MSLFNRISNKLLLVCVSFGLPITVMSVQMTKAKQKEIDFGTWELYGDEYQRPLEHLFKNVSMHRWLMARAAAGDTGVETQLIAARDGIAKSYAALQIVDGKLGEALQFTPDGLGKRGRTEFTVQNFGQRWEALKSKSALGDLSKASEIDAEHKALVVHLKTMITHSGDTSNLILDPDLDSYYLMDVTLLALPQMQDRIQEIAVFTEAMLGKAEFTAEDRLQARVFSAFLKEADHDRTAASAQTSILEDQNFYGVSPTLKPQLEKGFATLTPAVMALVEQLKTMADAPGGQNLDKKAYRDVVGTALVQAFDFHDVAFDEEDRLISTRVSLFKSGVYDALIIGAICLLFSAVLAFYVSRNIVRRVKRISGVTKAVAAGDLQSRVNLEGGDELAELGGSFDNMTSQIEHLTAEMKGINANLEGIVAERTSQITTILNNVKTGFLLVGPDLKIQDGFSRACNDLFGEGFKAGRPFFEALGLSGDRNAPLWVTFLEQAFEDSLPEEMTLQQLPSRFSIADKVIGVSSRCVRDAKGAVRCVLFTLLDATELEHAERESKHQALLVRLLREADAFRDFVDESKTRLGLCRKFIRGGEQGKVRAELHTIKGNTAAFDLVDIAKLVHRIEDSVQISGSDVDAIETAFREFLDSTFEILQLSFESGADDSYTVSRADIDRVLEKLRSSSGDNLALAEVKSWLEDVQFRPARGLFGALPDYASRLAQRLCKQVDVKVEGGETRMDPELMKPVMQSLVHLVRNAIDHGIEFEGERTSKPEVASIVIKCADEGNAWSVEIADDGRGIDTDRLVQKALDTGALTKEQVIRMSEADRARLIFLNGVSTSDSISDISGRGVGMGAVDAAVREAGGTLEVKTARAKGTSVKIRVPKSRTAADKPRLAVANG